MKYYEAFTKWYNKNGANFLCVDRITTEGTDTQKKRLAYAAWIEGRTYQGKKVIKRLI